MSLIKRKHVTTAIRYSIAAVMIVPVLILAAITWVVDQMHSRLDSIGSFLLFTARRINAKLEVWENNSPEATFAALKKEHNE